MIVVVGLIFASCSEETNPATNVTATSATLNGTLTWKNGEGPGEFWWEYSQNGGTTWTETTHSQFGQLSCSDPSGTCSIPISKNVTGLSPGSHYIYRLAGWITLNGNPTPTIYGDSNWMGGGDNDPPYEYDSFDTLSGGTQLPSSIGNDMTLTKANSPYLGGYTTIEAGATVTVEPGASLKVSGLNVLGRLVADGTAAEPIVFTSPNDDTVGGDTNHDGPSPPAPGNWVHIHFAGGSGGGAGNGLLDNTRVRYGGSSSSTGMIDIACPCPSPPSITNSVLSHAKYSAVGISGNGTPEIRNNTITDSGFNGGHAIEITDSAPVIADNTITDNWAGPRYWGAFEGEDGAVNMHDNLIEGNDGLGISVYSPLGAVDAVSLGDNIVRNNGDQAIRYETREVPADIGTNTVTGNVKNGIWVAGDLVASANWSDKGYPIVPMGNFGVPSGTTLTVPPGFVFKGDHGGVHVSGTLNAQGTSAEPIIFTSIKDDSVDGDTNGDGSASQPVAGDWFRISFFSGGTGSLHEARIRYGGFHSSGGANAMVYIDCPCSSDPSLTDSVIRHSETAGIEIDGAGSPQIIGNIISDNGSTQWGGPGIWYGYSAPQIANNEINDNWGGIQYFSPGADPNGAINIHDNTVDGNEHYGIAIAGGLNSTAGISLGNNTVTDNGEKAIRYEAATVPADFDENVVSGNGENGSWVSGALAQSTTWEDRGYPFVPTWAGLEIPSGKTLTLSPGVVFKGDFRGVGISGRLNAQGTSAQPITFTSITDDSVDGDTNGDGSASQPAPGDWPSLYFGENAGSGVGHSSLEFVEVRYGGAFSSNAVEVECPCPSPPQIRRSTFLRNTTAVYVDDGIPAGPPIVANTKFRDNTQYAIFFAGSPLTQPMWSPFNSYGTCLIPKPAGCGDAVNNVDYTPPASPPESGCSGRGDKEGKKKDGCKDGGDPVSLATGEFTYSAPDLALAGPSVPLEFTRGYNAQDPSDTGLGPGWSHQGLIMAIEQENGDVIVRRADGRRDLFTLNGSAYEPPSGVHDTLEKQTDGTYELTMPDQTLYRFDSTGRIASITDDHGQDTAYGYNSDGRLQSITDPSGQQLTFAYNGGNHLTSVSDSTGRSVTYTYTPEGDLDTVTNPLNGATNYNYDAQHRLTEIIDPRGNKILDNTYDSQGRVIEQLDGLNNLWTLEYSPNQTEVTDPENGTTTYQFDSELRLASETDPLGHTTSYSYDAAGNVDEITRPGGAESGFAYDSAGNLTQATDPEGGVRSFTYDSTNHLTNYTDPRNKTWTYDWTGNDLTTITNPDAEETEIAYNGAGQPTALTDANEHTTDYGYDSKGNLTSVTDPLDHTTTYAYNARNYLTSVTEPGTAAEVYERSALGDVLSVTTPEGHETELEYDANGFLVKRIDPALNEWEIERNAMERPVTYTDPVLNEISVAYDGNLNPTQITDRRNEVTTLTYDLDQRLTELERPEAETWTYGYDARDNLTQVTDPRSNTTDYVYDLNDRVTQADQPLNVSTSYGYNDAGNLSSVTDPRSNQTAYSYDDLGRLSQIAQPLGKTTSYAYDAVGNRTSRTTALGSVDYAYDAANRPTEISSSTDVLRTFAYDPAGRLDEATDADDKTIAVGYDDDNNVTSLNDGRGQTVSRSFNSGGLLSSQTDGRGTLAYTYDQLGRLDTLTDPQSQVLDFAYDPEGNLTSTELPNGVDTTNIYDGSGRMLQTTSVNGQTPIDTRSYAYDDVGNRTSFTDRLSQSTSYSYDALNRLTGFDPPGSASVAYSYDDAGNRTGVDGVTYTYDALNQLTSDSAGTTYSYDGAGRLTEMDLGSTSTTFDWSPLDELLELDDGTQVTSYTYDGLGRRSERTQGSITETAHYGDLSDMAILDTDSSGISGSYVQGPTRPSGSTDASNEPVLGSDSVAPLTPSYFPGPVGMVEERSGSQTSYPLADAHGDVTTLTSGAGAVASRQEFDPWGVQSAGPAQGMGYLGAYERRSDADTAHMQMGVRAYDPKLGQFLSEDPILSQPGIELQWNRYSYAWNNPLNRYDLNGMLSLGPVETFIEGQVNCVQHFASCTEDAVNYWANNESPASYVLGPLATLPQLGANRDKWDQYFKGCNAAQIVAGAGVTALTVPALAVAGEHFVVAAGASTAGKLGTAFGAGTAGGSAASIAGATGLLGPHMLSTAC